LIEVQPSEHYRKDEYKTNYRILIKASIFH
jgi:hypothetical protein